MIIFLKKMKKMKKINKDNLIYINGGNTQCEKAGTLFGFGAFLTAIPVTALAGVFIMSFGAAAIIAYDCPIQ